MADDKTEGPQPAPKPAPGPAPNKSDPPIKDPEVHVEVTPKEKRHREYADKVKENLKKEIKEKVEQAKPGGAKKQLDAAEKAADDSKTRVDPQKVEKLKVKVGGEVGPDGDKVFREKTVVPKEGK